jgi:RNA polymerase sigma-70 factor (ECF subfamily)
MMKRTSASAPRPASPSSNPPPSPGADLELARRAAAGDVRSTKVLLEAVAPSVVRAVRAMMGPRHPDADDAAQLALLAFVQALPTFRGDCDPRRFAVRIAIRTAGATRRRYLARYDRHDSRVDVDEIEAFVDEPHARQRRQAVLQLVDELPEEQAETMALRFVMGWKLHEIAEVTHVPFNTVRSRLRLAKEALLRRIAENPALAEAVDASDDD